MRVSGLLRVTLVLVFLAACANDTPTAEPTPIDLAEPTARAPTRAPTAPPTLTPRPSATLSPTFAPTEAVARIDHPPRILLAPAQKARLAAKKNANDATWRALKQRADDLATRAILPYYYATRAESREQTIAFEDQGGGWYEAALHLGLAFQMTGDIKYCAKLAELADEMLAAPNRSENRQPAGRAPIQVDNYFSTRYLGPALGVLYDWCYDALGALRRAQLVALMNNSFDDFRLNAYQANERADGDYFIGHLSAAAWMGYAARGDNARADEMIAYAHMRFDGAPSALVSAANVPTSNWAQTFEGGYKPTVAREYNGPNLTAAPLKGGFYLQGWAYGTSTYNRVIDYMLTAQSAAGEDLIGKYRHWFSAILRAQKHALLPNRFEMDPRGDGGGQYGGVVQRSLPLRLAYVLGGAPDGAGAQHFASTHIVRESPYPRELPNEIVKQMFEPAPWEEFFFGDATRLTAELVLPPYYSHAFAPEYPQGSATNGAYPYFIMRSDWGPHATWASARLGAAHYSDHQHYDAGDIQIRRANDALLIQAGNWKGAAGGLGIVGTSTQAHNSASANTLFFYDYFDFTTRETQYLGGQGPRGKDEIVAAEQNDAYAYIRSDLATAYNRSADVSDWANRKLEFFARSFLYLRAANVFVVFDQARNKVSTNPRGHYLKQLRWHFPNQPAVSGRVVTLDQGASRLYVDTVLPASVGIVVVDESQNPDKQLIACGSECDSNTWRVEVSDPANPLAATFLTVLQPGDRARSQPATFALTSHDAKMTGVQITQPPETLLDRPPGRVHIVLFNNQPGQTPMPLTSTAYTFSGPTNATHTLLGFVPNARYAVLYSGGVIKADLSATGNVTASGAGVLRFALGR